MTPNPIYHGLAAIAYIVGLVSIVFMSPAVFGGPDQSIFYPILALSTLVLSVAVMAYLFFYQPLVLMLDGKRKEAATFFLQTVSIFAVAIVCTVTLFLLVSARA